MPSRRACHASPCAMLPALAVYTPRASASFDRVAIAFPAPRSLKEPIGWRFSSFNQIRSGRSLTSRRTSGVRIAEPAMRPRAARISSRVGGSSARTPVASEIDGDPPSLRAGARMDQVRRREVLDRDAQGLEEGHLARRAPAGDALEENVAQLADDVRSVDRALLHRDEDVARLRERRLAPIDDQARPNHGRCI